MKCPNCGTESNNKFCPECGHQNTTNTASTGGPQTTSDYSYAAATDTPKKTKKKGGCLKTVLIVLGVIVVLGVIGSLAGGKDGNSKKSNTPDATQDAKKNTINPIEKSEDDNIPTENKSALKKAKNYSDVMYMSKQGIYNQLTSEYGEKFSPEAAQYAMDNLEADWNTNALEKAKSYSDSMYMSKMGIYDQLVSESGEQFTAEEAQYAIDTIEADWNANALAKAKHYQESMSMSPEAIRDQLVSDYGEKFTQEEADYAIANLN